MREYSSNSVMREYSSKSVMCGYSSNIVLCVGTVASSPSFCIQRSRKPMLLNILYALYVACLHGVVL